MAVNSETCTRLFRASQSHPCTLLPAFCSRRGRLRDLETVSSLPLLSGESASLVEGTGAGVRESGHLRSQPSQFHFLEGERRTDSASELLGRVFQNNRQWQGETPTQQGLKQHPGSPLLSNPWAESSVRGSLWLHCRACLHWGAGPWKKHHPTSTVHPGPSHWGCKRNRGAAGGLIAHPRPESEGCRSLNPLLRAPLAETNSRGLQHIKGGSPSGVQRDPHSETLSPRRHPATAPQGGDLEEPWGLTLVPCSPRRYRPPVGEGPRTSRLEVSLLCLSQTSAAALLDLGSGKPLSAETKESWVALRGRSKRVGWERRRPFLASLNFQTAGVCRDQDFAGRRQGGIRKGSCSPWVQQIRGLLCEPPKGTEEVMDQPAKQVHPQEELDPELEVEI